MLNLPKAMISIFVAFAPLFSRPVFKNVVMLLTAHFLCTGKRTVTNLIRRLGMHQDSKFTKYHYVIRKAIWSPFNASKILFFLMIERLLPKNSPIEINIDTNLNRRRGSKIKGLGYHRDAVASSKSHKVLACGHNWLVVTLRVEIFGSKYKWSLPFLSYLLTPKEPLSSSHNKADLKGKARHKKMPKVTCQIILQIRRWIGPERVIIVVADSAFACREICKTCQKHNVIFCSQLRLNASLHDFPPDRVAKRRGRPRVVGARLPNLTTLAKDPSQKWAKLSVKWYGGAMKTLHVLTGTCIWYHNSVGGAPIRWILTRDPENGNKLTALFITDFGICAKDAIELFVGRWPIETTFQEVHQHLGLETIHTWSDLSINRTAPAIIASYSVACLISHASEKETGVKIVPETTAWYRKETVTFSDVMIYLRMLIFNHKYFTQCGTKQRNGKIDLGEIYKWMACA